MRRFQILPTELGFYDWFEKGAENCVESARLLDKLLHNYTDVQGQVQALTETEHHGDFIVHEIFDLLHQTFLAPFDRDAIQKLATSIDDVVDAIEAAGDALLLYKVERPMPEAIRLGEIILESCQRINEAVPMLRDKKLFSKARERTIEVNRLENEADRVARVAAAHVLERPDQLFEIIRWTQIIEDLESATDRCEDVADVLQGIIFENA